jgi:hypothetical protein
MVRLVVMARVIRPLGFTTLVAEFILIRLGSHVSGRPRLLMIRLVLAAQVVVRRRDSPFLQWNLAAEFVNAALCLAETRSSMDLSGRCLAWES